ncbi:MAG: hypothetical protein AABX70_07610 [Nanoarchaeota archaeon]
MTFQMKETGYEGFPVQHPIGLVQRLNEVNSRGRSINNVDLRDIGLAIDPQSRHTMGGETSDGYKWFGKLEFELGGTRVAVLFPWHQDFKDLDSQMDRSINVYSSKAINPDVLSGLLEQIAYQTTLVAGYKR